MPIAVRLAQDVEGDATTRLADQEAEIIAKRAHLLRQIAALEADLRAHRVEAIRRVERDWSKDEIGRAKGARGVAA